MSILQVTSNLQSPNDGISSEDSDEKVVQTAQDGQKAPQVTWNPSVDNVKGTPVDDSKFLQRQKKRLSKNPIICKINYAKKENKHPVSFLRKLFVIFTTSTCFTLLLMLVMFIPLSKITIGSIFYHDCPAQPFIPLYLIVGGLVACARDLVHLCVRALLKGEKQFAYELPVSILAFLYSFLEFAWFIHGSILVYKTFGHYQSLDRSKEQYCNVNLYMYAFVVTTLTYFLLFMITSLSCVTVCLASFLDNEPEPPMAVMVIQTN